MDDGQTPSGHKPGAGFLSSAAGAVTRARRFLKERLAGLANAAKTMIAGSKSFLARPAHEPGSPAALLANARRALKEIIAGTVVVARELIAGLRKSLARRADAASVAPVVAPVPEPGTAIAPASSPVTEAALASIIEARQRIRPELSQGGIIALIPSLVIFLLVGGLVIGVFYALNYARYLMARGILPF